LRLLRRILITAVVTLGVVFVGLSWFVPVALSYYTARKAPPVARIVPTDLSDISVSAAPGKRLSYFGYEFEIPWSDLDESQIGLYPKDKPDKSRVDLRFHSGLRLLVTAFPPRVWVNELATSFKVPPERIESSFGGSDYHIAKTFCDFTPDKMNHWSTSQQVHFQEGFLLVVKSMALSKSAETGIFNVQNQNFKGFQQGNPQVRQDAIEVHLFSDDGSVEFVFLQKEYRNSAGVTQPEINRIVQSLHRVPQEGTTSAQVTNR
jgi:hypothetical protein